MHFLLLLLLLLLGLAFACLREERRGAARLSFVPDQCLGGKEGMGNKISTQIND